MAYDLNLNEPLGAELRKLALAQIGRLQELLSDAREPASGHHKTRRCLKRIRALLMLLRPNLGTRRWRPFDRVLANIGRALSGERDKAVVLDVLARIVAEEPDQAVQAEAARLTGLLRRPVNGRAKDLDGGADRTPQLAEVRRIARQLEPELVSGLREGEVIEALAAEYRAGRRASKSAYELETDEAFHDLRKHVQRHARHMQLLHALWTDELQLRHALAKQLADRLGHDHDLALLKGAISDLRGKRAAAKIFGALERLSKDRQLASRCAMQPMLNRLYADRPKAFALRMTAYWSGTAASPPEAGVAPEHPAATPARSPAAR